MTVHTIMLPDYRAGKKLRSIVWDDVKGTVEGEHSKVERIREHLAQPTPLNLKFREGWVNLEDPAHKPADFLRLLWHLENWAFEPEFAVYPPTLRDVEPTEMNSPSNAVFDKEGRMLGPGYYDENGEPVVTGYF